MASYEERAVRSLDSGGGPTAMLRGIGYALLALAEVIRGPGTEPARKEEPS